MLTNPDVGDKVCPICETQCKLGWFTKKRGVYGSKAPFAQLMKIPCDPITEIRPGVLYSFKHPKLMPTPT